MNPRSSSLLRNTRFRNFLAASTISLYGTMIFDIAVPLYVLERTHSAIALSMAAMALSLPYFLMAPLTGFVVDNFDKRSVMLCADVGQVLCMLSLFCYDLLPIPALWPILLTVFVVKSCMNLFETVATFQLVPALVEPRDLAQANTWFLSSQRVIQVVGPISGGILMSVLGFQSCIIINMVTFGATLFFVYTLKNLSQLIDGPHVRPRAGIGPRHIFDNFRQSIRYIWSSPLFKPFIFLMFFWNLSSLVPNTPSITFYFTEMKRFSAARYGSVVSLFGVAGVLGYLGATAFYRRFDFRGAFVGSCVWQATFATLAILFFRYPVVLAILFACSRLGSSVLTMGTFLLRQTEIPKHQMGGINACLRMFFMSAAPLSAIIQGFLIHHVGVALSMLIGAVCLWAALFYARQVADVYAVSKATTRAA